MRKNQQKKAGPEGQMMKGAQIVVKCLERANVEILFAYPGGTSLELHQALRESSKLPATNKAARLPPMAMHAQPARQASAWLPAVPAQRTSSRA